MCIRDRPKTYRGKQSIKHLVEQNAAISNIEVTDGNIKSFERTANKYGIDYALKKDLSLIHISEETGQGALTRQPNIKPYQPALAIFKRE